MQTQRSVTFDIYKEVFDTPDMEGVDRIDVEDFVKQKWVPKFLDDIWVEHYRENAPMVVPSTVNDVGRNRATVLVGASPAIKRQVKELQSLDDNFVIISSNGAYRFLAENGITPHYVAVVEGRDHVVSDFDVYTEGTTLIAAPYVSPSILKKWKGPIQFCLLGGTTEYADEIRKKFDDSVLDLGGGNVTSTAMLWAYKYLCSRNFIFVGMSLCYYEDYYWDNRSVENVCDPVVFEQKQIKGIDMYGKIAYMTPSLCLYKVWIEAQTKEAPGAVFINSTEDGVLGVLPKPVGQDGDMVQFQVGYVPWINIVPLRIAIEAYKRKFSEVR